MDLGVVKSAEGSSDGDALIVSLRSILTSRSTPEIVKLAEKLSAHGIKGVTSFQVLSKITIETKLSPELPLGELADVLEVWTALQKRSKGVGKGSSEGYTLKGSCKDKSETSTRGRSRSVRGCGRDRGCSQSSRLLSKGCVGVNSSLDDEHLSLWTATIENNVDEVTKLVRQGVSTEMRHQNWTPLMAACERGHFCIALFLLEHRADTSAVNKKGRCALSFAAAPSKDNRLQEQRESSLEIIKLLATHGAIIDNRDRRKRTPRDYAERASKVSVTSDPRLKRAQAAKLLGELELV